MDIKNLEPRAFFHWFEEISKVPRESHKEEKIKAFLVNFFQERGLDVQTDKVGNVFAHMPATPGYEDQPSILFQAHMDMVCRKEEGVQFDFDNDPIELVIDGDLICANGTTLGADNAVGIATMLAIADDPAIDHPELELLFTACEEQGMVGIKNFDFSQIRSRRMVNMDCGDSHVIASCSAGKVAGEVRKEYQIQPITQQEQVLTVRIDGALGGHSSICANKNRCCCANAMGYLLSGVENVRVSSIIGSGPIIKDCTAVIAVAKTSADSVVASLQSRFDQYKGIYASTDPDIKLSVTQGNAEYALAATETEQIGLLLSLVKTGQIKAEGNDPATIMSLSILCEVQLADGKLFLEVLVRSTCGPEMERIGEYYQKIAKYLGFDLVIVDRYPVWSENPDSPFRAKFQQIHQQLYGTPMEIERVPGGIEVVFITQGVPDMDPVGIAPTARGAHTTKEHLFISEVEPYWTLMKAVLAHKE